MMQAAKLVFIEEDEDNFNVNLKAMSRVSKPSYKSPNLSDEFKLLEYKSELLFDYENETSPKIESCNNLKAISIAIVLCSLVQTILFVFVIPNNLSLVNKINAFFIVFGWTFLLNNIFFMPKTIRVVANYLNQAFTDYECL